MQSLLSVQLFRCVIDWPPRCSQCLNNWWARGGPVLHFNSLWRTNNCWTVEKSSCTVVVHRCINNWWPAQPSNHISGILPFLRDISWHAHLCRKNKTKKTITITLTNTTEPVFVDGIHSCFMRSSPECPHLYDVRVFMRLCCCFCKYFLLYLPIKNCCLFMTSSLRSVIMFMGGRCSKSTNFQEVRQALRKVCAVKTGNRDFIFLRYSSSWTNDPTFMQMAATGL